MSADDLSRNNPGNVLRRLAGLPIPLFLVAIGVLAWLHMGDAWNPPYLLPVLNLVFLTGISVLISVLAAKSHLDEPSGTVLLLGCGTLILGLAGALAAFPPGSRGPNWTATIYNCGAFLAAACHLASAVRGFTSRGRCARAGWPLLVSLYLVAILVILLLTLAVYQGYLPVFFVQGQGATIWDRATLLSAAAMFLTSALLFSTIQREERSAFTRWYALGLGLIAIGLVGVSLQHRFGSPLNWSSRAAQYLGGVYLLLGVISAARQSGQWRIPLAAALREVEERYRSLVELCPDAILVHSDGKYLFANPAAVNLFGARSAEEMIGRDVLELIHPEDREAVDQRIRQRLVDMMITPLTEIRILRLDGSAVEVEVTASRIEYNGKPSMQIVLRDITERKRAEAALRQANELRESEERFRMMVNAIPQMAAIARPDGYIYWFNQRWHDYTGTTPEQMADGGWQRVHDPQVLPEVLEQWQASVATGQPFEMEIPLRGADGRYRCFLTRILPLRNSEGQIVQWIGTNTDITAHKEMEAALRASEAQYKFLTESILDVFTAVDRDLKYIFWNKAAEELTGISAEEALGKTRTEIFGDTEETRKMISLCRECLKTRQPARFEVDTFFRGRRRVYDIRFYPTDDGVSIIARDITEQKQAEAKRRESEEQYRRLFELESDAIFLVDSNTGHILDANIAATWLYGYSHNEFLGLKNSDVSAEPHKSRQALDDQKTSVSFRWHRKKDGTVFPVEIAGSYYESQGRHIHVAAIRDITERKRAEEALAEQGRIIQNIFDTTPGFLVLKDCNSVYLEINEAFCRFLGKRREEIIGRTDLDLFPPAEAAAYRADDAEVIRNGVRIIQDELVSGGDGKRWLQVSKVPLMDASGNCKGILCSVNDITERKQYEEALRESEERYDQLAEQSRVMVWEVDAEGLYTYVSRVTRNLIGYQPEEVIGRMHFYDLHPEDGREEFKAAAFAMFRRKAPFEGLENSIQSKDGGIVWVSTNGIAMLNSDGTLRGYRGTDTDITERKRADEALRRSAAELADAQAITHIGSWRMTLKEGVENWSGSAELHRIYGYPGDMPLAMQSGLDRIHPEDRQASLGAFEAALRGTGPCAWEHRIVVDGQVKWILVRVAVHRNEAGQAVETIGTNQDITVQRELEEHLRQSQKLEAIGQLAGGVAHDFNNMLTGILGYSNMLKLETTPGTSVYEAADVIEKAAERAADLTRKLLGFGRRGKFLAVPVNVNEIVHEVAGLLGRTVDRKIRMTQRLGAEAPLVLGDPGQLQQVILNLAINARDAMADGGDLTIETRIEDLDEAFCREQPELIPGRYAVAEVSDTGVGIAAEIRDRIFEPFFTTKPQGEGTGMGLAMVYGIVRNHGGHIDVASEAGRGSTFKVYLPLHAETSRNRPAAQKENRIPGGLGGILLVDDEPVLLKVAGKMLRTLGYEVFEAGGGREAIGICATRAGQIDLAVVDMVMPEMDGGETLRALRQIKPDIKAILSSGFGIDERAQKIIDEGTQGFIQKPYKMNELAETVARALQGSGMD